MGSLSSGRSTPDLDSLLAQLTKAVEVLKDNPSDKDLQHRRKICGVAEQIVAATKVAEEAWCDYSTKMAELAALRMFMEWKVFENIPTDGSISYKDLAAKVDAEEDLITRLAGALLSTGVLALDGEDRIAHTRLSSVYGHNHPSGILFKIMYDECMVPYAKWPQFFAKYGKAEPKQFNHNPHSFAYDQPEKVCWEIISSDKQRLHDFNQSMNTLEQLLPITGMYDFSWLQQHKDGDRPLIVDVGGGKGQALKAIMKENPWLPKEKLALQDRPDVIEQVVHLDEEEMKDVMKISHDFFTEQPVKGAYIYWIRRCLHDWSDENDAKILSQLEAAMGKDSRVLITEQIMSNPPSQLNAQTDLCMLNIGGKERSERMFEHLVSMVGLKIVKIHKAVGTDVAVIECDKA